MVAQGSLEERIGNWIKGLERDIEFDDREIHDFEDYITRSLDDAESSVSSDPSHAYSSVLKVASVSGHVARKKPFIVDLLSKHLQHIISVLNEIKKAMGATSFSVTVSFPFDLSISLSF